MQQLNFRLSYNDIKLFLGILQSMPSLERRSHKESFAKAKEKEVDGMGEFGVLFKSERRGGEGGVEGI